MAKFKLKGDPMGRNFGVGRTEPGVPYIDGSKNKLTTTINKPTSLNAKGTFGGDAINLIDKSRSDKKIAKAVEQEKNTAAANPTKAKANNWWEEGYGEENKEAVDSEYKSKHDKKPDFFSGLRPLQQALGLSKEQRAARKLKKADKLTDAKAAEESGTETFKQAKFVDKAERKQSRSNRKSTKKKAKSDKKLAEYREKNN